MQPLKQFGIAFGEFNLNSSQFDIDSRIHGVMHTYRVMCHVLKLGMATGKIPEARNAFFAAYIHDMARSHDGYCAEHGSEAAAGKLPLYAGLFIKNGATNSDLLVIEKVVSNHCEKEDLKKTDPDWHTMALLKDADALDRIRLGEDNLKPEYLRIPETFRLIDFAKTLFYKTENIHLQDFAAILKVAQLTNQELY